jgi:mannose-6-phosphate isomerase-like protein (cupin superfamily)
MTSFQEAMRRVITGDDENGQSVVIIDGGPSSEIGAPDLGGLFEIWEDSASGPLDPQAREDLGTRRPVLGPRQGNVQVRWFVIAPTPDGVPKPLLDQAVRERFAAFDGARHIIDQTRHPAMHETHSMDVICLLQGEASLILEGGETRLKPGQVVIQRGTNHAWQAHGGPALLLAVLIDRPLVRRT